MFYKYMLVIALALSSFGAMAQSTTVNPCDNIAEVTSHMNQNEVSTLLKTCRNDGVASGIAQNVTPENVSKWAPAAKGIAEAIGIAAKELGIATNDFLKSPAGFLVAAILIFNFGGGAVFAVLFTAFTLLMLLVTILRLRVESREYEFTPMLWGAFTIRRVKQIINSAEVGEGSAALMLMLTVATLLLNMLVWFNIT